MPQIAICENLPVPMIIGKDWQLAVYARIINEPDGKICIITPTQTEYFTYRCVQENLITRCIEFSKVLDENEKKVMELVEEFDDIFKKVFNNMGKFTDFELEINLKHNKPISCKPYILPKQESNFSKKTVDIWIQKKNVDFQTHHMQHLCL